MFALGVLYVASFDFPAAAPLSAGCVRYYENFEIDDTTGKPLTRREVTDLHYDRLQLLQRVPCHFWTLGVVALATFVHHLAIFWENGFL